MTETNIRTTGATSLARINEVLVLLTGRENTAIARRAQALCSETAGDEEIATAIDEVLAAFMRGEHNDLIGEWCEQSRSEAEAAGRPWSPEPEAVAAHVAAQLHDLAEQLHAMRSR